MGEVHDDAVHGGGMAGAVPEGHPSMHSTPMAHAWYQAHGEHPSNPASEVLSSGIHQSCVHAPLMWLFFGVGRRRQACNQHVPSLCLFMTAV